MRNFLGKFGCCDRGVSAIQNERGSSAIEYGLLATGIVVAVIAIVAALGADLNPTLGTVSLN